MSIMSAATISCLDTRVPIPITEESRFFDAACKVWNDGVTVVNLMKREATDRARYAYQAATAMATPPAQPTFRAAPVDIRATGPIPRITDMTRIEDMPKPANTSRLLQAWEDEGEQPTVNLETRPMRVYLSGRKPVKRWKRVVLNVVFTVLRIVS